MVQAEGEGIPSLLRFLVAVTRHIRLPARNRRPYSPLRSGADCLTQFLLLLAIGIESIAFRTEAQRQLIATVLSE